MATIVIKSLSYTYFFFKSISIPPLREVSVDTSILNDKDIEKLKTFISSKIHISETDLLKLNNKSNNSNITLETTDIEEVPTVESLPLYTLNKNGDYVLTTPDIWLKNGEYYIPAYRSTTLGVE